MNIERDEFTNKFERGKRVNEIVKSIPSVISTSTQEAAIDALNDALKTIEKEGRIESKPVKEAVEDIVNDIIENQNACLKLIPLRVLDDYIFTHSINVAMLSVYNGVRLNFPKERVEELGVGAMLHDIGKAWVPKEILKKKERLTPVEFENMKRHTEFGYKLLSTDPKIFEAQKRIAYYHHEKYNGCGYPRGLKGDEIDDWTAIVALSNAYDALASDRAYRQKLPPYEVMRRIIMGISIDYPPKITEGFMNNMSLYPPESIVRLNSGETAIVIRSNPTSLIRPVIRLLTDKNGYPLDIIQDIDLSIDLGHFIREVIKDTDSVLKEVDRVGIAR